MDCYTLFQVGSWTDHIRPCEVALQSNSVNESSIDLDAENPRSSEAFRFHNSIVGFNKALLSETYDDPKVQPSLARLTSSNLAYSIKNKPPGMKPLERWLEEDEARIKLLAMDRGGPCNNSNDLQPLNPDAGAADPGGNHRPPPLSTSQEPRTSNAAVPTDSPKEIPTVELPSSSRIKTTTPPYTAHSTKNGEDIARGPSKKPDRVFPQHYIYCQPKKRGE